MWIFNNSKCKLRKEISDSNVYKLSDEESSLLEVCITIEEAGEILCKIKF